MNIRLFSQYILIAMLFCCSSMKYSNIPNRNEQSNLKSKLEKQVAHIDSVISNQKVITDTTVLRKINAQVTQLYFNRKIKFSKVDLNKAKFNGQYYSLLAFNDERQYLTYIACLDSFAHSVWSIDSLLIGYIEIPIPCRGDSVCQHVILDSNFVYLKNEP
jgi:hypothetical protein